MVVISGAQPRRGGGNVGIAKLVCSTSSKLSIATFTPLEKESKRNMPTSCSLRERRLRFTTEIRRLISGS
jgi:hypothetical protein